jgi:hypothetical protein
MLGSLPKKEKISASNLYRFHQRQHPWLHCLLQMIEDMEIARNMNS